MVDEDAIVAKFQMLAGQLDERAMRLWAAAAARACGLGGTSAVSRATGIARSTISRGRAELERGETLEAGRVRRPGAGRKALTETDPTLLADLDRLIGPEARGDPELALRWTAKSLHTLARELREMGHEISARSVAPLLHELGYSLQSARKAKEGKQHPDRDAQFRHINKRVSAAITAGESAISIDTKKKELVGEFKNAGQEWRPAGEPVEVLTHDFPSDAAGKAIPSGSTTSPRTRGSSTSGSTARLPSSRSTRSAPGGISSAARATPRQRRFRSPSTVAAATATARSFGRPSCKSSPRRPGLRSRSATSRRGPRSGTRSSTGCGASSPRTGAASR